MPHRSLCALTLLALCGLTGCAFDSSGGSTVSEAATLAGPYEVNHEAWGGVGYRWEWTSQPPLTRNGRIAFADAYEDLLIVQDTGAMLSVIEAPTGKIRWNTQVGNTATRFLGNVRRDGSVIVTNETELFEFDLKSGNTLDRTPINTIATTKPVLYGDTAVLGVTPGRALAFDLKNNIMLWDYRFDGQIEVPPLKVDDNRVTVISSRGDIRTLAVDAARTISSGRISGDAGDTLVTDGYFQYIASVDQSVYAYEIETGERMWRIRDSAPVLVQPVLLGETLYVTTKDTGLTAILGETGEVLWSNPAIGGWVVTTNDSDLMVWNGRDLIRVDAERGDVIAKTSLENLSGLRADAPEDGNIYAITLNGAVAKFSAR